MGAGAMDISLLALWPLLFGGPQTIPPLAAASLLTYGLVFTNKSQTRNIQFFPRLSR